MMGLLPQARRLLAYIVTMERQGERWSYRSAAVHLDIRSNSRVHELVHQLVERGYIAFNVDRYAPLAAAFAAVPRLEHRFRFIPAPHDVAIGKAAA